jgi:hypothetical protein
LRIFLGTDKLHLNAHRLSGNFQFNLKLIYFGKNNSQVGR